MQLTVSKASLVKALGHVYRVAEKRNTIPILGNVLMRVNATSIAFKATDFDIEVMEAIEAEVQAPGAITAPAHMLHNIVRKLPDGADVSLKTDDEKGTLTIRAGRSRFNLQTLPEADFPDLTAGEFSHRFTLPGEALKGLLDKTAFATSTEETRYYLRGIYLHQIDASLRTVATNGHKLARADIALPEGADGMPGVILPSKTVAEVQRLIGDADGEITIELAMTKVRFTCGDVVIASKLIDGTFPDYQRVIPSGNDKRMLVDKTDFVAAVDRMQTVLANGKSAIRLSLADGTLKLSTAAAETGSATEELNVEYGAEPLDIGFNARYLLDITSKIKGESVVMMLADPGSPTIIQDADDASTLYVLMPMRMNG